MTSNWIGEINQTYADFGYSVSTAGDVNGDGYSDVIIGADLLIMVKVTKEPHLYITAQFPDYLWTSNWSAEENQVNAGFGYSVSTAGDVNGDGYSDVIVGAPYIDNGISEQEQHMFISDHLPDYH